jgi:hypothetical protein
LPTFTRSASCVPNSGFCGLFRQDISLLARDMRVDSCAVRAVEGVRHAQN